MDNTILLSKNQILLYLFPSDLMQHSVSEKPFFVYTCIITILEYLDNLIVETKISDLVYKVEPVHILC